MTYGTDPTSQVISRSYKGYSIVGALKPLWTVDLDDEEKIIEWADEVIPALLNDDQDRGSVILNNRNFYMGLQSFRYAKDGYGRGTPFYGFAQNYTGSLSKIFANQVYDLIEQKVAKMTRYPANIDILPANDEFSDRQSAKISKLFVDHSFYVNDMYEHLENMARYARTDGESFLFIEWDKDLGDMMPGAAEAFRNGRRVPLLDKNGEPILGENREPLYIEKPPRVGDIRYSIVNSYDVLLDPKENYRDCDYCIKITRKHIDEVRAEHPGIAIELDEDGSGPLSEGMYRHNVEKPGDIVIFEIYHRHSQFLGKGRYIKMTASTVLVNEDLPYSHGELPMVRLVDIAAPGELRGVSFLQNIMLLQVMYNQLFALMYRNVALGAHLYWMVPKGAQVSAGSIRNSESIITYSGGIAPTIQTFRTVGPEVFNLLALVREELQRVARIHGVSRGEVPARAESGVFLAALEEQENAAHNAEIKRQNAVIKKIARHTLAVAGDYYQKEDGRTLRIVGKNMEYEVKALEVSKLSGPYEIRLRRTTALSESPATRLAQIQTIKQTFPNLLPDEQVMDMLDLANEQKYYDITTQAVRAAEYEIELMNDGVQVEFPQKYEALLVHWDVHSRYLQTRQFKESPEDIKELHLNHMLVTEAMIYEKAFIEQNPAFQQKLLMYENYPLVFEMPRAEPQAAGAVQQGAGTGAEQGGQQGGDIMQGAGNPDEMVGEPLQSSSAEPIIPGQTPQPPLPPQPDTTPVETR